MRQVMMNGPILSPHGQISSPDYIAPTNQTPRPGLLDSPGLPAYTNGHTHHAGQTNGYPHSLTSPALNAATPLPNGANQSTDETPVAGWSARYSSLQATQLLQRPQYSPTPQNPFLNSFERQRPGSSHATHNIPSPTKNHSSFSPSQVSENAVYGQTPDVNGTPAHRLPPATPQPPSYSPIKQQSSPPMPAMQHSPSSPSAHPSLHQNAPSSPGFSPTKHSPPRSFGAGEITSTPVLPPVENLSPSPQVRNPPPPVKSVNGVTHEE